MITKRHTDADFYYRQKRKPMPIPIIGIGHRLIGFTDNRWNPNSYHRNFQVSIKRPIKYLILQPGRIELVLPYGFNVADNFFFSQPL